MGPPRRAALALGVALAALSAPARALPAKPPAPHAASHAAAAAAAPPPRQPAPAPPPHAFVVLGRSYHDAPYAAHWAAWYRALGFHVIIVNTTPPPLAPFAQRAYDAVGAMAGVHVVAPGGGRSNRTAEASLRFALEVRGAEWVLLADTDEFLVLDAPTIAEHLRRIGGADALGAIQFRTATMELLERSCPAAPLARAVRRARFQPSASVKTMWRAAELARIAARDPRAAALRPTPPRADAAAAAAAAAAGPALRNMSVRCDGKVLAGAPPRRNHSLDWAPYTESAMLHVRTRSLADLVYKAAAGGAARARAGAAAPAGGVRSGATAGSARGRGTLGTVLRARGADAFTGPGVDAASPEAARAVLRAFVGAVGPRARQPLKGACDTRLRDARAALNTTRRDLRVRLARLLGVADARVAAAFGTPPKPALADPASPHRAPPPADTGPAAPPFCDEPLEHRLMLSGPLAQLSVSEEEYVLSTRTVAQAYASRIARAVPGAKGCGSLHARPAAGGGGGGGGRGHGGGAEPARARGGAAAPLLALGAPPAAVPRAWGGGARPPVWALGAAAGYGGPARAAPPRP